MAIEVFDRVLDWGRSFGFVIDEMDDDWPATYQPGVICIDCSNDLETQVESVCHELAHIVELSVRKDFPPLLETNYGFPSDINSRQWGVEFRTALWQRSITERFGVWGLLKDTLFGALYDVAWGTEYMAYCENIEASIENQYQKGHHTFDKVEMALEKAFAFIDSH